MEKSNRSDVALELKAALNEMRALRDQVDLKVHLASMDARDAWKKIEPAVRQAETEASDALVGALRSVEATARKLREVVASM